MKIINKLYTLLIAAILMVAVSCTETETQAIFEGAIVGFNSASVTAEEDGDAVEVGVQLIGTALSSDLEVTYEVTAESGVSEGDDYTITGSFVIPAGEYTSSIEIQPIDNEDISEVSQTITMEIISVNNESISIGAENLSVSTITILDNDFFCPRNDLSKVVTTELDVGFSTNSVSIAPAGTPEDGCLEFRIVGGAGSLFGGFANISYVVALVEDSPESNTGTVEPADTFNLNNGDGSSSYTNLLKIIGGTYNLSEGILEVDYEYYGTDNTFQYSGTFRYSDGS